MCRKLGRDAAIWAGLRQFHLDWIWYRFSLSFGYESILTDRIIKFPDPHFIHMDLCDVNLEGCVHRTGNCREEVRAELPPGMGHVWDLMEDISRDIAHEIHRSSKPIEEFVLVRALFDSI